MNRVSKKFVAILTLSIITLTVLAPDFIWKAQASDEYSIQNANTLALSDISDFQYQTGSAHHDDHPCGCHMFSHLPIQASASSTPRFPELPETFGFQVNSIHSSHIPDSIDYPPKSSLA